MTATQGKRKKAQVAAQMAASRDEQPQQLVTSIAASVSGLVQQEYEQGSPIHGLVQTDAGDPQATPSLHALQWRAAVISALMSEPETSLKRLSANSGLFWLDAAGVRNSHEAAGSMYTGKLEFGRMPVAPAGGVERKARVLTIFMRNNRPTPVLLTELLCLPDSGHFQWYYATGPGLVPVRESKDKGSGDGRTQTGDGGIREMIDERYRVLNQEALPLRVEANATVSMAVRFHPTFEPGFYDQWLLFRFEVARQYLSDLFSFTTQHAVLGLVVSASCLSNEDASVLFNAEVHCMFRSFSTYHECDRMFMHLYFVDVCVYRRTISSVLVVIHACWLICSLQRSHVPSPTHESTTCPTGTTICARMAAITL